MQEVRRRLLYPLSYGRFTNYFKALEASLPTAIRSAKDRLHGTPFPFFRLTDPITAAFSRPPPHPNREVLAGGG